MEVNTGFDPRVHGFGFGNRFRGGSVVAELGRQDRLSELTGLKVPRVVRQMADLAAGDDFWGSFGLCGGMSWTTLDRYLKSEPIEDIRTVPSQDTELFHELVGRQADSMRGRTLLERCVIWQFLPDQTPWWMVWSKGVGRLTVDQEWPRLKESLEDGKPASIVLIRNQGIASPGEHHQVVAIGYRTNDRGVTVELYDPNHPRSRPTIPLDTGARTCGPKQSTGEPTRGFFVWSPP